MPRLKISLDKNTKSKGAKLPRYGSKGAAGLDFFCPEEVVFARVDENGKDGEPRTTKKPYIKIRPGEMVQIFTGVRMAVESGYFGKLEGRSSKEKIRVSLKAGVLDEDYRGEITILLVNEGRNPFLLNKADAIAQMIIKKYEKVNIEVVDQLDETERGEGGFGSTDKKKA